MSIASDASLRVSEIFCSIQGESTLAGERTVFIRLTGCPLRCVYCDTAYAFQGGEIISLDAILQQVADYQVSYVCVTGGEPLAQPQCEPLLEQLCDAGYTVSLETSGAMDIAGVDDRVRRIVDIKTPSSGEQDKNLRSNIALLDKNDELKFVIADRDDYLWARQRVEEQQLAERVACVLFSPVFAIDTHPGSSLRPVELAEWILADRLPVRLQVQMHKLLWGDEPGH